MSASSSEWPSSGFLTTSILESDLEFSTSAISNSESSDIFTAEPFTVLTSTLYYSTRPTSTSQEFTDASSTPSASFSADDSELSANSTFILNANSTYDGYDYAGSSGGSNAHRRGIIIGAVLGSILLVFLLLGWFCYYKWTRRSRANEAQHSGVLNSAGGYSRQGRRGRGPDELLKETQQIDGISLFTATSTTSMSSAINSANGLAGHRIMEDRSNRSESFYNPSSLVSAPPSLLLPREVPSSSNSSSHLSLSGGRPLDHSPAIALLDATSVSRETGPSAPSIASTERSALRQLSLPESWGRQVSRTEMTLEQKRAQEKFLVLPEPAYSAEGINAIRRLRVAPPKEEQGS